jgi:hypothetical protein
MEESSPVDAEIIHESSDSRILLAGSGAVLVVIILILAATQYFVSPAGSDSSADGGSRSATIVWDQSIYMPRHEECVDESNGQDLPEFGIGYEPSISITSNGNMFITAHKDLRWGGEDSPIPIILDPDDPGPWWACTDGRETTWDYWASWFWASYDNGSTWGHGENFGPTPGNMLFANYLAGGSECLGDEGDISVDAMDTVYYLDTTLEDNWWHTLVDHGTEYSTGVCQRMNTMAADDRPWVAAQGDGIIHYLGNSGASPPECTGDTGRYWYYHSEDGGNTFSQCYSVPGGWSTISSQRHGSYVYIAQENADTQSGTVTVRISDEYGRGTGFGDGTWAAPIDVGPREGNCPEGYPVVNNNEGGTVAVVWADCPNGSTGTWDIRFAISYDYGTNWSTWNVSHINGIQMYPFVSISDDDMVSLAFYGLDFDDGGLEGGYVEGEEWFLYAGALQTPVEGDSWDFAIADPEPLHVVTGYEEQSGDVHALHDFFETVLSPDGSWVGIAYQQNLGQHPFEENEEQRYIKFVRGDLSTA